jgi:hypothetical protein
VKKEQERVAALREQVALFPEMQQEIQPRYTNEEERKEIVDHGEAFTTAHTRARFHATWREARAAFYQLSPHRRRGMRLLWNQSSTPRDPYYFAIFVKRFSSPGMSPWTHLRKVRLVWLWNHGGWARPAHFRDVTSCFDTLGPVIHARLITQSFHQCARLEGISSRLYELRWRIKVEASPKRSLNKLRLTA